MQPHWDLYTGILTLTYDFVWPCKHVGLTIYKSKLGITLPVGYYKWVFKLTTWALNIPWQMFPFIWLSL